ncbi:hypothetical protein Bbelb_003990 [Branchiostoma belcheri]|nr:hypothetical protein Bbelb_003990 [Branchiostoma belcheri]
MTPSSTQMTVKRPDIPNPQQSLRGCVSREFPGRLVLYRRICLKISLVHVEELACVGPDNSRDSRLLVGNDANRTLNRKWTCSTTLGPPGVFIHAKHDGMTSFSVPSNLALKPLKLPFSLTGPDNCPTISPLITRPTGNDVCGRNLCGNQPVASPPIVMHTPSTEPSSAPH